MTSRLLLYSVAIFMALVLILLTALSYVGPAFAQAEDPSSEGEEATEPVDALWEFNPPPEEKTPYFAGYRAWVLSHGKMVYASRVAGGMYALDAPSGKLAWSHDTDTWIPPTAADGVLYIGNGHGRLDALDAESGEELWSYEKSGAGLVMPTAADGVVYAGIGNAVHAVETASGQLLWFRQTAGALVAPPHCR